MFLLCCPLCHCLNSAAKQAPSAALAQSKAGRKSIRVPIQLQRLIQKSKEACGIARRAGIYGQTRTLELPRLTIRSADEQLPRTRGHPFHFREVICEASTMARTEYQHKKNQRTGNKENASTCTPYTTRGGFGTFRGRDVCWVSSMTSHADVQGASEALVLHDCGWVLQYARFVVILPTEGQQAPFHIFPAGLAHKAGMDPWSKSSRWNISHTEGLNEVLTLSPGCVLAQHTSSTCCTIPKLSAAGWFCLQLQENPRLKRNIIMVVISGQGKKLTTSLKTFSNPFLVCSAHPPTTSPLSIGSGRIFSYLSQQILDIHS